MLYAAIDGLTTIVAAADTLAELDAFQTEASSHAVPLFRSCEQPDVFAMMADPRFLSFRKPPLVFEHTSEAQRDAFLAASRISVLRPNALRDRHDDMMAEVENDPYVAGAADNDSRTVGDIHGITEADPWDQRTDEQRNMDEHYKKLAEEAKKAGKLSGDSFGPGDKAGKVHVTDIRSTLGADGKVTIDDVLAVKIEREDEEAPPADPSLDTYRFATSTQVGEDHLKALGISPTPWRITDTTPAGFRLTASEQDMQRLLVCLGGSVTVTRLSNGMPVTPDIGKSQEIDPNGVIAIFFRADIPADQIAPGDARQFLDAVADVDLDRLAGSGSTPDGWWVACAREAEAQDFASRFPGTKVYGISDRGERLVPEGVEVVDEGAETEELPRLWNSRTGEIAAMDFDERMVLHNGIRPAEFIFCGAYNGPRHGCILYVAPRSYFDQHDAMYPEALGIAHILPRDLKEIEPGVYTTLSRDWSSLSNDLFGRGFNESLALQLHLNNRS